MDVKVTTHAREQYVSRGSTTLSIGNDRDVALINRVLVGVAEEEIGNCKTKEGRYPKLLHNDEPGTEAYQSWVFPNPANGLDKPLVLIVCKLREGEYQVRTVLDEG